MKVGDIEIVPILDGVAWIPKHHRGFAQVQDDQWQQHAQFLDGEHFRMDIGGLLIKTKERVVLVDLGISRFGSKLYNVGGRLLESLTSAGFETNEVTDVLFTHLHIDHVGWASDDQGHAIFEHATYRCHVADWEYFVEDKHDNPDDATSNLLWPIANRMEPWTRDITLFPSIDILCAPGHTPGSSIIVVSSNGGRALLLGDVVHCPVQLLDDEWAVFFDVDADLARRTRSAISAELEATGDLAAGCHFPNMAFGRVIASNGGRKWVLDAGK